MDTTDTSGIRIVPNTAYNSGAIVPNQDMSPSARVLIDGACGMTLMKTAPKKPQEVAMVDIRCVAPLGRCGSHERS